MSARQAAQLLTPAKQTGAICPPKAMFPEKEGKTRGYWAARVPAEHTIADVQRDDYFQNFVEGPMLLRVGDEIEIEPMSMVFYAKLRVLAVFPQLKRVVTRVLGEFYIYEETPPPGFSWEWKGEAGLWAVKKGGVVIGQGYATQTACLEAVKELRRGAA